MSGRCIAYLEDGRICRKPGTYVAVQLGGLVCDEHAKKWLKRVPETVRDKIAARRVLWPANADSSARCTKQ